MFAAPAPCAARRASARAGAMDYEARETRGEELVMWLLALASVVISVLSVLWVFS